MAPRRREFYTLGQGIETTAFHYTQKLNEGSTVIKGYDQLKGWEKGITQQGFNRDIRDRLERNYFALRSTYGDIIPRQHFLRRRLKNKELYKLIQRHIPLADPAGVFQYTPEQLGDATKQQLSHVAIILQDNIAKQFLDDQLQQPVLLDVRSDSNLVLGQDGKIYYLDSGFLNSRNFADESYFYWKYQLAPLAMMKYIAGESADQIVEEPIFNPLVSWLEKKYGLDRTQLAAQPKRLYAAARQFYYQL
ncbi:MAG: hypothetical protein HYV33_02845 [Candidatus Kerfeldbacteria bacterium]|nr:hypothetical protein [Candidatus Kerfeldbacteria bacterium]